MTEPGTLPLLVGVPRALRLAAADVVIFNDGLSLAQLGTQVRQAARGFGL